MRTDTSGRNVVAFKTVSSFLEQGRIGLYVDDPDRGFRGWFTGVYLGVGGTHNGLYCVIGELSPNPDHYRVTHWAPYPDLDEKDQIARDEAREQILAMFRKEEGDD